MAVGAFAAALAVGGAVEQRKAAKAQNKAQKKAAELERARASIETRRNIRKSIAAARIQRGEILAQTFAQNTGGNSAVGGALGSLRSDTASEAGDALINLSSRTGQSLHLQRGASKAVRHQNRATFFNVGSTVASGFADIRRFDKLQAQGNTKPPVTNPGTARPPLLAASN